MVSLQLPEQSSFLPDVVTLHFYQMWWHLHFLRKMLWSYSYNDFKKIHWSAGAVLKGNKTLRRVSPCSKKHEWTNSTKHNDRSVREVIGEICTHLKCIASIHTPPIEGFLVWTLLPTPPLGVPISGNAQWAHTCSRLYSTQKLFN